MRSPTQLILQLAPLALASLVAVCGASCITGRADYTARADALAPAQVALVTTEARPAYPIPIIVSKKKFNFRGAKKKVTLDMGVETITPHFKGALKACGDPPKAFREELREDSLEVRAAIRKKTPQSIPVENRYHPVGQVSFDFETFVDPDTYVATLHDAGVVLLDKADELDADILILTLSPINIRSRRGHLVVAGDFVFTAYQLDCSPPQDAP